MRLGLGLALALASALVINVGLFFEHSASALLPPLSLRRPLSSARLLLAEPLWLAGYLAGWIGWAIYIGALHFAALSVVQSVAAGGIGFLALAGSRWGGRRLSFQERVAVVACLVGLAAVGLSLIWVSPPEVTPGWHGVALWIAACVAGSGLLIITPRRLLAPGLGLAGAAGCLYAASDIATKGALSGLGWVLVPVLLLFAFLAFSMLQLSFQRGTALATAGFSTLMSNAVPIAAGVVLFRERLPGGILGVVRAGGFAAILTGAVLLARRARGTAPGSSLQPMDGPGVAKSHEA